MSPEKIGSYPIEREVGRGGMGVVYLGHDPRLKRPVAIKVLPDSFALDPERLGRFEREARMLASITHANIAGIYGLEESEGKRFLALEYVEGDTLGERLERGPLSVEDTLDVCRQIAGALEAAHEAGIIHRDLKPGNVKLTPTDEVKVLDFGLAKGSEGTADSNPDLSQSPTMTHAAAAAGVILGTAAYMSPEQARGKLVDRRTDIWSFGCVLYECLTGQQAFAGETVSDMIALILQGEPDWSKLPERTPDKLRSLLARCLEKDARKRLRDIGDARIELEELQSGRISGGHSAATAAAIDATASRKTGGSPLKAIAGAAALIVVGAIAGIAAWNVMGPQQAGAPTLRFKLQSPPGANMNNDSAQQAISPDGSMVAYAATDSTGETSIWVRALGEFEARELPGTRNAEIPFWSPDGEQLAFFSDSKLRRVRIDGGNPEIICDAATGRGGSWNREGLIVFGSSATGPLYKVRAGGGTPEPVTVIDTTLGETAHRWPSFLPDGVHFTYAALPVQQGEFQCYVGSINSMERTPLIKANAAPIYAAPGYLIFNRNESLLAQRFDVGSRQVEGEPLAIGAPPTGTNMTAAPGASVSDNGVLAWMSAGQLDNRVAWIDRSGREAATIDIPLDRWTGANVSPDGRRAIIGQVIATGNTDLWVIDLEREVVNRITYEQGSNSGGVWSPDSREIIYSSTRQGTRDVYRRAADGSGSDVLVYQSSVPFKDATSVSPDGNWVVIQEIGDENGWNLIVVPTSGGEPRTFLASPFDENAGIISPDGNWLLYVSNETGSSQIYVQSFPNGGNKVQVSRNGAFFGVWAKQGREILFIRTDGMVVSIPVSWSPGPRFGNPRELHRYPDNGNGWGFTADGERFLITLPAEQRVPGISIAVNWRAGR